MSNKPGPWAYHGASKVYKPSWWNRWKNDHVMLIGLIWLWGTVIPFAVIVLWLALIWGNGGWFPIFPPAWGWGF